ncbi:hypothetical protein ABB37_08264 [Leptomonas pyrrhocoris]|uniref:Uncharacterized protein n=1 Tax=Leptomonas pyrrhocoris TaxID=157538 RepID=A0A0M9FTE8_LEPPY|nr:hypothetical protein ABB37_08264 [Leptomonas pyrrhocoris]KPA75710.1 hypothetical protein ABB37_08264 [Leptomonas pyrrhocoris]|eukprot:XP_015654149.1 hypothetical protein ABB37_08264 [Leptomonas pyrrhocoris]
MNPTRQTPQPASLPSSSTHLQPAVTSARASAPLPAQQVSSSSSSLAPQRIRDSAEHACGGPANVAASFSADDAVSTTSAAAVQVGAHAGPARPDKTPVLTSVWLDASCYTYDTLCKAGAASITVVLGKHEQVAATEDEGEEADARARVDGVGRGASAAHAGSSSTRHGAHGVRQLIPHEITARKRPRGHPTGNPIKEETSDEVDGAGVAAAAARKAGKEASLLAGSAPTTTTLPLQPAEADARLDVLEEVELCSVVPRLLRTFGMEELVQQVVPCTAFMAADARRDDVADRRGRRCWRPPGCLARLRMAADQHLTRLYGRADPPSSLFTLPAAVESEGGFEQPQPIRPVSGWLPPVPAYMKNTAHDLSSEDFAVERLSRRGGCRDDQREGEGSTSSSSTTPSSPYSVLLTTTDACTGSAEPSSGGPSAPPRSEGEDDEDGHCAAAVEGQRHRHHHHYHQRSERLTLSQLADDVAEDLYESVVGSMKPSTPRIAPTHDAAGGASGGSSNSNSGTEPGEEEDALPPPPPPPQQQQQESRRKLCFSFSVAQALYERQWRDSAANTSNEGRTDSTQFVASVPMPHAMKASGNGRGKAVHSSASASSPRLPHDAAPVEEGFYPVGADTQKHADGVIHTECAGSSDGHGGHHCNDISSNGCDLEGDKAGASVGAATAPCGPSTTTALASCAAPAGLAFASHLLQSDPALDASPCDATCNTRSDASAGRPLPSPAASSAQETSSSSSLLPNDPSQAVTPSTGAVVEWVTGAVSYTADTEGILPEQQSRAQRFFFLPPPSPSPSSRLAPAFAQDNVQTSGEQRTQEPDDKEEDLSTLRGAVLAQLLRLQQRHAAATAYCHGDASRVRSAGQPPEKFTGASASLRDVCALSASGQAARTPTQSDGIRSRKDLVSCRGGAPTTRIRNGIHTGPDFPCACHRCSPLQLHFAQVPLMASSVLLRYLDLLHATALPSLQSPCPTSRRLRSGVITREDAVTAGRIKKDASSSPAAHISSNNSNGSGPVSRDRQRSPADPIDLVFPALQQWFTQTRETDGVQRGQHSSNNPTDEEAESSPTAAVARRRPSSNSAQKRTRRRTAAPLDSDEGARLDTTREGAGRGVSECAPAPLPSADLSSDAADAASLGWIDDAVLDETVVIGVVPRGQPHQLRLVAPSCAFVLALVQRLEEVSEVAFRVLTHVSLPAPVLEEGGRSPSRLPHDMKGNCCGNSSRAHTTAVQWQAWLENTYMISMWNTLREVLNVWEWCMVVQQAETLPFLPAPSTLPSLDADDEFVFPAFLQDAFRDSSESRLGAVTESMADAVRSVFVSVRSAAALHTTACLSAAEDATARVILTALTPLLHRRITVMYELLRHLASKSLYASHRAQCEAYQRWYATTPTPAAVLRLLQRSRRFRGALARCYPQYNLMPLLPTPQGVDSDAMLTAKESPASREFPAQPLTSPSSSSAENGVHSRQQSGSVDKAAAAAVVAAPSMKRPRPDEPAHDASKVEPQDEERGRKAGPVPTKLHPPPAPLRVTPTTAAAAAAAGSEVKEASQASPSAAVPWSPVPDSPVTPARGTRKPRVVSPTSTTTRTPTAPGSSPPPPLSRDSPITGAGGATALMYVPEVALLDPRYLQRFAWWTHRTYHGSGSTALSAAASSSPPAGGSSAGGSSSSSPPSQQQQQQQQQHAPHPVMSIPGDYLRVLPLQEQDAGIRTVLRSMSQKGRTLDMWEMSQHIQAHRTTPYVYH